ncbi:MAG: hypothetical protein GXO79_01335 [Chlorobi bacterium]|nr:hypothetical protein [Chlorobiota bacterium]
MNYNSKIIFNKKLFKLEIKILFSFFMLFSISAYSANTKIDSISFEQQIKELNIKYKKINSNNHFLKNEYFILLKNLNAEIHNQQYKNDSLFGEIQSLKDEINLNVKKINKTEKYTEYIRKNDVIQQQKVQTNFILLLIFLILIYLLTALFLFLLHRKFNGCLTDLENKLDKLKSTTQKEVDTVKDEYTNKLKEEVQLLKELNNSIKEEILNKFNDHRASTDGKLRDIHNQIDNKIK